MNRTENTPKGSGYAHTYNELEGSEPIISTHGKLKESRAFIGPTVDAIIGLDNQFKIFVINEAVENLFGLKKEDLLNRHINEIIPEYISTPENFKTQNFIITTPEKPLKSYWISKGISFSGDLFDIEISISELRSNSESGLHLMIRPIMTSELSKLQDNQFGFSALFNPITDVFFRVNKEGFFESVSSSSTTVLDYAPNEMIGENFKSFFVYPEDWELIYHLIKKNGACKDFLSLIHDERGKHKHITITAKERIGLNGKMTRIEGVIRNASLFKQTNDKLVEKTRQFRDLFEFAPDAIFIHDFKEIKNVNKSFLKLFGYKSKHDIIGKPPKETMILPEDHHLVDAAREKVKKNSQHKLPLIRHIDSKGNVLLTETYISLLYINGAKHIQVVSRDISNRLRLERNLKTNQEILNTINANSPDHILTVNEDLQVTYVNKFIEPFNKIDMLGTNILNHLPENIHDSYLGALKKALRGTPQNFEIEIVTSNKKKIWYDVRVNKITSIHGKTHLLIISADISKRKQVEIRNKINSAISNKLNGSINFQDFCKYIQLKLAKIPGFKDIYVAGYNEDKEKTSVLFQVENGKTKTYTIPSRTNGNGLFEYIIRTGKDLLLNKEELSSFHYENNLTIYGKASSAWIGTPIISNDKIVGVLAAESFDEDHNYSQIDRHMIRFIGTQIGKLIERTLALNEIQQYERYFSVSMDLLCIANLDGYFKKINPKFSQTLGYTVEEILNQPFMNFVHPDDVEATEKEVLKLTQGMESINFMNRYRSKSGEYKWFLWAAAPDTATGNLYCAAKEITEQKKIEQAAKKLADIVSHSNDAIISSDQNGNVSSWNLGAEKLLGYSTQEMIGTPIKKFAAIELLREHQSIFKKVQMGASLEGYETQLKDSDNNLIDVNMSIFPITEENGKLKGVSCIIRDISNKKEAERIKEEFTKELEKKVAERTTELKNAQKQLAKSLEKEKELGELKSRFVATASHQFRTPLTIIQSSMSILSMHLEMGADQSAFQEKFDSVYRRITGQIQRMTELMSDVLIIGKINSGRITTKLESTDLIALCNKICVNYNEIQEDQRIISLHVSGKPRELMLDQKLMEYAISNLVSNAFKYSQNRPNPEIEIHFQKNQTLIRVKDHGSGIPDEDKRYLFEPFFRASNVKEILGTGLGLSIAKEYIELNGGVLSVNSVLDIGTEFKIGFKR